MGYYISQIEGRTLEQYFGSKTIYNCAFAFDGKETEEFKQMMDEDPGIIAIVGPNEIEDCLNKLKNNSINGRDVQLLIDTIEAKFMNGFKIIG
ncbi:MAG: hypothetical protein ABIP51_16315 [Bacteroidia bacterium]